MILSKTKQVCPELSRKGFTLIELLTVIAIIIILAGAVIVNVTYARERGRDAKRTSDLQSIQTALESFNNTFGIYPGKPATGVFLSASDSTYWRTVTTAPDTNASLYCQLVADSSTSICTGTLAILNTGSKLLTVLPADPINRINANSNDIDEGPPIDLSYLYYVDANASYYVLGTNLESVDAAANPNTKCGNYTIKGGNSPSDCPVP